MLHAVRRLGVSRLAALTVALALSGGARLAAELREPDHHRCLCPRGAHDCSCPVCREAERRRLEEQAVASAPPCHRAAVRRAADDRRTAEAAVPALRGCGEEAGGGVAAPAAQEPFLRPRAAALPLVVRSEPLGPAVARAVSRPACPELPPPRSPRSA